MKILLVEDDKNLAAAIVDYLELDGIICDHIDNGVAALNLLAANHYQVLVLDINLPKLSGYEVCKQLRQQGNKIPVIMLTAKGRLEEKLTGFEMGADDYLVKPFAMDELVARVKALSGRVSSQATRYRVAGLEIDINSHIVKRDGQVLKLSPLSFKLLSCLMKASPAPVERSCLMEQVWGDNIPELNSLKVHIHNLRKEIKDKGADALLHTIPALGYVIREPDEN
ncbi:response regulator transcription factor [Thalassomonas viridans]|uniref:Response regulator transcription factor n=1 Tax=Thalassomonas viridans TaxID=137584 RepID=A0AAF0CE81_9GAMM|nr:response regulator transcription factor [Thalassomonas viridans]WDE09075.1 response regulator transcription factor [Thalassomonas viridans]